MFCSQIWNINCTGLCHNARNVKNVNFELWCEQLQEIWRKGWCFPVDTGFYCMILSLKTKHCKCWFTHRTEDILKCLSHFGVKLCFFKYPSTLGLVQCVCCPGEVFVMLGFSYLFFIHPLNMVLCLLWWTVYYWHMSPLTPPSSSLFLLSWLFHQCFVLIFIHLLHTLSYWHSVHKTHTKNV